MFPSPAALFLLLYVPASFGIPAVDKVFSLTVLQLGPSPAFPQSPLPLFNTGTADSHFLLHNSGALFYQAGLLPAALSLAMTPLMKARVEEGTFSTGRNN